ncbi:hypothetical protein QJQ45_015712 [Haematococcus lacustris]|nr:hypothetical protein QJQ45_015712 [Haematococcus lacustris]
MTCLKSLGIRHATELQHTIAGHTYIISGQMLKERFHNKVQQKHYIALNRLTTMATQDRCPTTTEAKDIAAKRDTTLDLPAAQRLIKPWAAGLTELAPTDVEEDTKHRYADIRAYATAKKTTPTEATHVTGHATQPPAAQEAIKSSSRLLRRENRETQSPPTKPARPKAGTKRNTEGRQIQTIPEDIVHIIGLDLPGLSSWKVDKACRCKPKDLGSILGAMYGHQEAITSIDGWQWDGINKESYYKVHWKPTIIDKWALPLCAEEGYTPSHIEPISREEAKDVCTCELCWLPRGDSPTCHNCKRAYHPACLEEALLSGHKEPGHWLCPICKFGSNEFKTTMRLSAHSDLIRVHWRPTLEPAPLITAHLDYLARRSDYEEENNRIQEARYARPDTQLPTHTRQGLPDPHTWLPRCTNLHSKATFHTYPINPQTDIVGTGKCETFLQLHPHMTTPAMNVSTGEPIMPKHDLVQHVTIHDESGRTVGLLTKQQHQHLHAWLQHTPHTRNLATELVALLRRQDTQSSRHPMRLAQDKALTTLHTTRSFPSTVQRWADPLTVRPETTTYWSPDINDTAFGAHHNCLLVRHTGLSTWNVPADDAVALKCVNHAIHSAHQEEAMATIMLIPGKKGISYPKHIDTLRRYPEYCQHLASIPLTNTNCSKLGKHATLLVYVIWNEAGQLLTTKGNPQGWMASTATALHPDRETHPLLRRPHNQKQPATLPSGHKQHLRLPLDRTLPTLGHTRSQHQLTHHSTTLPRMAITEWTTVAYTDGSCIKTSEPDPARVGAGVYIPESNALLTIAMNDLENNTINKAELTAIHAALKAGARRIATDSLCSLYQIRRALANPMSLINHRHNDILTDIATLIIDSPVTTQFYKVRAHSGIIGNEGADALAKHAALHPEKANTLEYHPTTPKERGIWLNNGTDGENLAPLPDCRHSVRAHMHSKHKLGLANQDSIYYQMTQDITKAAAKGAGERVMTDATISIPAQRTALLYRTGGLYNQKLAMRWKQATDDRCPLCGEADSATHLLSGCSETLPLVQERHNGAGRLIAKAISKGTLGGCIRFADTGSWEKGARENLDLPNDTLHTTLRALGMKPTATKNTTRPDIIMVAPQRKTGKRGKATKRITIIEIKYCADSRANGDLVQGQQEIHPKRKLRTLGREMPGSKKLGNGLAGKSQASKAQSDSSESRPRPECPGVEQAAMAMEALQTTDPKKLEVGARDNTVSSLTQSPAAGGSTTSMGPIGGTASGVITARLPPLVSPHHHSRPAAQAGAVAAPEPTVGQLQMEMVSLQAKLQTEQVAVIKLRARVAQLEPLEHTRLIRERFTSATAQLQTASDDLVRVTARLQELLSLPFLTAEQANEQAKASAMHTSLRQDIAQLTAEVNSCATATTATGAAELDAAGNELAAAQRQTQLERTLRERAQEELRTGNAHSHARFRELEGQIESLKHSYDVVQGDKAALQNKLNSFESRLRNARTILSQFPGGVEAMLNKHLHELSAPEQARAQKASLHRNFNENVMFSFMATSEAAGATPSLPSAAGALGPSNTVPPLPPPITEDEELWQEDAFTADELEAGPGLYMGPKEHEAVQAWFATGPANWLRHYLEYAASMKLGDLANHPNWGPSACGLHFHEWAQCVKPLFAEKAPRLPAQPTQTEWPTSPLGPPACASAASSPLTMLGTPHTN